MIYGENTNIPYIQKEEGELIKRTKEDTPEPGIEPGAGRVS